MRLPDTPRRLVINSYPMLIDAARSGAGVALGWGRLVDADLLDGRLVHITGASVTTRSGYWRIWRYRETLPDAVAALFYDKLFGTLD